METCLNCFEAILGSGPGHCGKCPCCCPGKPQSPPPGKRRGPLTTTTTT